MFKSIQFHSNWLSRSEIIRYILIQIFPSIGRVIIIYLFVYTLQLWVWSYLTDKNSDTAAFLGWSLLPSTMQASNPGVVVLRLLYSAMSRERTCEWVVSDSWIVASAIGVGSCANITCSCYRPRPSTSGWCSKCELMLLFDCIFTVATDDAWVRKRETVILSNYRLK